MENYGDYVFIITTANGSVPLSGAHARLKWNGGEKLLVSKTDGITYFSVKIPNDGLPFLTAEIYVNADGYYPAHVDNVMIYKNIITVRIINLDRI